MSTSYSSRMELAALAHRRYPDMELPLAIMCLESDRRHAGLGALDERKRRRGNVSNYKVDAWDRMVVIYHLKRHTPARREYPKMSLRDFSPGMAVVATATVTLVEIPEKNQHLCVNADYHDFCDQAGRHKVAMYLREARRQLRAAAQ